MIRSAVSLILGLALWLEAAGAREPADIVAQVCANCHGKTLTGQVGPNLLDSFWIHGKDDASVLRSIRDGWPGTGMPAFRGILSDSEMLAMVAYLHEQGREYAAGRIQPPASPQDLTIRSERQTFRIETYISNLDNTPWGMAFLPDGRILVTERPGHLRVVERGRLLPEPVQGTPAVFARQDGGLLDIILHPKFAENGWIYLAYTETARADPTKSMTVVVRGRIRANRWIDEQTLFRASQDHYYKYYIHYGCRFLFDGAGHLFFTIGDRGQFDIAQDLSNPCGKIHRVFDDGSIPPDNPFVGRPGALPSIWSYGHRHPQGLDFHPVTGRLWEAEHGPIGGDEVNRIEPGHNYGWPVTSQGTESGRTFLPSVPGMDDPLAVWTPAIAPSGIRFYNGNVFPRWKNSLFVAALAGEQVRRLETDGDHVVHQEILFRGQGRARDVVIGPDGLIYILLNNPGRIVRLRPLEDSIAR